MARIVWRMTPSSVMRHRSALVVISPATTTKSVVTSVSQATRLIGSAARQWSSTASLIWSATLSGWPMLTDSLVKRYRSTLTIGVLEDVRVPPRPTTPLRRIIRRLPILTQHHSPWERLLYSRRLLLIDGRVRL